MHLAKTCSLSIACAPHICTSLRPVARPVPALPFYSAPSGTAIMASSTASSSQVDEPMLVWNKETNLYHNYDDIPIIKTAKIVSISSPNDPDNALLHEKSMPMGCELVQIVSSVHDINIDQLQDVNAIFCSFMRTAREPLAYLVEHLPNLQWIHCRQTGIDFLHSDALKHWQNGIMTNAKGQFSSTLAEYALGAMTYFAKDFPRLHRSKANKAWDKFSVQELRGATLGIIGYGDIGRATARLAKAYGMKILALSRRQPLIDGIADEQFDGSQLHYVLNRSDYVVCATPLTKATTGMMGRVEFAAQKKGSVFINVGRGPTVDEPALIEALTSGHLKGAGLDVFCKEPLPKTSPFWELDNVLLSSHNMDKTETFMQESVEFYCKEQLPRFVRGLPLYNKVDYQIGY